MCNKDCVMYQTGSRDADAAGERGDRLFAEKLVASAQQNLSALKRVKVSSVRAEAPHRPNSVG